nr:PREDICTED: uncharacterized protein LOC109039428 [Bemisia tabaci]
MSFLKGSMRERGQKSNLAEEDTSDVIGIENDETQFSDSEETEFPENFESNDGPVPPIVPTTSSAPPPVATVSTTPSTSASAAGKNDSLAPTSQKKEKTKTPPIKQTASSQVLQAYLASKKKPEDDHLSKFFAAMEATVRKMKPIFQIKVKAQVSSIIADFEMQSLLSEEASNHAVPSTHTTTRSNFFAQYPPVPPSPSITPSSSVISVNSCSSVNSLSDIARNISPVRPVDFSITQGQIITPDSGQVFQFSSRERSQSTLEGDFLSESQETGHSFLRL